MSPPQPPWPKANRGRAGSGSRGSLFPRTLAVAGRSDRRYGQPLRRQVLAQPRGGFGITVDRRSAGNTVGDAQRRKATVVDGVELRAARDEKIDERQRAAAIDGAVQRRFAVGVDVVDGTAADLECE